MGEAYHMSTQEGLHWVCTRSISKPPGIPIAQAMKDAKFSRRIHRNLALTQHPWPPTLFFCPGKFHLKATRNGLAAR